MFAFAGPAYLVSVGYMDPGNWATDIEGGARFGYQLLWVLVMSNLMAILLQTLSARLGIVHRRDLAQACRETYPRPIALILWMLCEVAIAACDLAEVLGAAIGLNLLFGLPLLAGVAITALDSLVLLWLSRYGIRIIETFVLAFITVIGGCFLVEVFWARPALSELAAGLIPSLNGQSLYVAIGILGATVMPHNLYLHSALVQTRNIRDTHEDKKAACRFNLVDSVIALNGALLVNAAILVVAGAVFFKNNVVVTEIQQAYQMLTPLVGAALAGVLFAVALMVSGFSSTITGTMAGQIVMEGFLNFRMRPWLRRLITRMAAIVPAALTMYFAGEQSTFRLLILSQVVLSVQLPFAVIPLIHFTNDRGRMGEFANKLWVKILAWTVTAIIVGLNIRLAMQTVSEWFAGAGEYRPLLWVTVAPVLLGLFALLAWITLEPWLPRRARKAREAVAMPAPAGAEAAPSPYRRILVPLDHTARDRDAVAHAAAMAKTYGASVYLLHIEEDVTSQVYGDQSSTAEVRAGERYLEETAEAIRKQGVEVHAAVGFSRDTKHEIVRYAREIHADLVVMAAHGHKGIQDLVYGHTIDGVRHSLEIPLLIVRGGGAS
jgi:manganese transport protein